MEELTRESMPRFLEQLRAKLTGRAFVLHATRGVIITVAKDELRPSDEIEKLSDGVWTISLGPQPFSTFVAKPEGAPVRWDVDTARTWYEFTDRSVRVLIKSLHPNAKWEGEVLIVIQG